MKQHGRTFGSSGFARHLTLAGVGAFVMIALAAKWAPLSAQENGAKKKAAPPAAKKEVKTPAALGKIPGAGTKLDQTALAKIIDSEINKRLQADKVPASPRAGDTEFLRRVYLDIVGVIPPVEKVEAFLKDTNPNKRAKVIDELLADARFGTSQAEIWSGLMLPRESNNRRLDHSPMQKWMADAFNANMPLDKMAYEILTATGDQDKNGAVTYFVANPTVDKMTDNVTKVFMGVQLQCAQCHNHPFTDYKQKEYWGMAAFFMKTKLTTNPNAAAKKGIAPGIIETARPTKGKNGLPEAAQIVPAKFLQASEPKLNEADPYRPVLGQWITSKTNPFFAKAMTNRFWYHFMGRGLVNPVDDMHDDNAPSHPELLAAMTEQLKQNDFDLKYLVRAICNSDAYQRSSVPTGDNGPDKELYSHRIIRVLSPEQLYDSLTTVLKTEKSDGGRPERPNQNKKGGAQGGREGFLNFFRVEDGNDPLEYQAGIPQALRLMNSNQLNAVKTTVNAAATNVKTPAEAIDRLFMSALSRHATAQETTRMTEYLGKADNPMNGYSDILWALLNSSEFALNH